MDRTGQQLGSYQISLAQGPQRWTGTHRMLSRPVELIRLDRLRGDQPQLVIDAVAALDDARPPSTARVYDLLPDPDELGVLWLVQELLDGQSLDAAVRSGPLPVAAARTLCARILPALDALHTRRLAHGGLSPARILLTEQGPVLTGFVEARLDSASEQHLAPELWSRRSPSPTSDVYAFGVCLYEALTGTPPFPRGLPRAEYGRLHKQQGIPDLATRRPDLPQDLLDIVQKATQKNPRRRPRSAQDLQQHLQHTPTPALAPTPAPTPAPAPAPAPAPTLELDQETSERPRDRRWLALPLAVGAGLMSAALCGVAATSWLGPAGLPGLLHTGPRVTVDNPTSARVTVACSAGPERVRVGAILEPSETQTILLAGVPADCIGFTPDKEIQMRWRGATLPADGAVWTATIGDGLAEAEQDTGGQGDELLLELLPSAEDDTGEADADVDVDADEDADAQASAARPPRPPRPPRPAPEVEEEVAPVGLRVTVDERRRRLARDVSVYVDGELVGEAPVTWAVQPGDHEVRWLKADKLDLTCVIGVGEDGGAAEIDPSDPACP